MICPTTAWVPQNTPGGGGFPFGFGDGWCSPWPWLVAPYIKSGDLFQDPQAPMMSDSTRDKLTFPSYGLNYVWLTPWDGQKQSPVSMTSLDRPADTVMIASKWAQKESDLGRGFLGFGFSYAASAPLLNYTVETPNCYVAPSYCVNNWGVNSFATAQTVTAGKDTGANSVRNGNQTIVGWLDGHAKGLAPGRLSAGTNWNPKLPPEQLVYTQGWETSNLWGAK